MANSSFRLCASISRLSCLFFFLFSTLLFSQSINQEYNKFSVKWRNKSYDELVAFFESTEEKKVAVEVDVLSDLLLKKVFKEKDKNHLIEVYHLLADANRQVANYEESIYYVNKAISFFHKRSKFKNKSAIYLTKATILYESGDLEGAMKSNLKALAIAGKDRNKHVQLAVNQNIALIKYQMNDLKGALGIYLKNIVLLKEKGLTNLTKEHQVFFIKTLIATAKMHADLGNFDQTFIYNNEVIKYSEIFGHYKYKAYGFLGLSNVYSLTCSYEKAWTYLNEVEKSDYCKSDIYFKSHVHLYKARTLFHQKHFKEAINELDKTKMYRKATVYNSLDSHEINVLYAKSYQNVNDLERASFYSNKAFAVFEDNKKKMQTINTSLTEAYDTGYLKAEIETLSSYSKKQKRWFFLSIMTSSFLLLSFFGFYQRQKKKNKLKFKTLMYELHTPLENKTASRSKEHPPKIEDEKVTELLQKLEAFEAGKGYLDSHSSLNEVAKKLNTNTSYLSKVVNQYKGLSFTKYLTELRLDYAVNQLKNDRRFRSYTIKGIAQEVGFNSPEPFAKAFKKKTGIYPSYFIKRLDET